MRALVESTTTRKETHDDGRASVFEEEKTAGKEDADA